MTKATIAGAVAALLSLLIPASGEATETIGNKLAKAPDTIRTDSGDGQTETYAATLPVADQASGGLTADAYGIITRWRLATADNSMTPVPTVIFRTLRETSPGNAIAGVADPAPPITSTGVHVYNARVPIEAGQQIGLDWAPGMAGQGLNMFYDVSPNFGLEEDQVPAPAAGSSYSYSLIGVDTPTINADIEPDADRDGFGDETQDLCPGDAAVQGTCPVAAPAATKKKCKRKKHRHGAGAAKKKRCRKKKKK